MNPNDKIITTVADVQKAAEQYPGSKPILKTIFPKAFTNDGVFAKFGNLILRRGHPANLYALVKIGGKVKMLTFSSDYEWTSVKEVFVKDLKNPDFITFSEFEDLMGSESMAKEFVVASIRNSEIYRQCLSRY